MTTQGDLIFCRLTRCTTIFTQQSSSFFPTCRHARTYLRSQELGAADVANQTIGQRAPQTAVRSYISVPSRQSTPCTSASLTLPLSPPTLPMPSRCVNDKRRSKVGGPASCLRIAGMQSSKTTPSCPLDLAHPSGGPALWVLLAPTPQRGFCRSKLEQKLAMKPSLKFKTPLVTSATVGKHTQKSGKVKETKKTFNKHRSLHNDLASYPIALILRNLRTFSMSRCISKTRIYTQCTDETVDSACY